MPRDPVTQVLTSYPVIHHALRQREVQAGGAGVSAHQATVLAQVDGAAGKTLTELAAAMGVALPTMSLTVDRLVAGGWLERARDPADGRRVSIRLTEAGQRMIKTRSLIDPERVRALLASLTPAERAAGVLGLTTLARAAQRLAPADRTRSASRGRP